jgi:hypothetical protein
MATKSKYGKPPQEGRNLSYLAICPDSSTRERLLEAIRGAISRCTNELHKNYASYGGRGIFVCHAWLKNRSEFLAYLTTLAGYDNPELEIDRIDNDRGYEPGNIKFSTRTENNRNQRRRIGGRGDGVTKTKRGRWQAQLSAFGKKRYLGVYETRDEAKTAVALKRVELGI